LLCLIWYTKIIMEIGIIGLPNVGKSTLFNILTNSSVAANNFPFTTIEPNVGICQLPDARLKALAELFNPDKTTPATVRFVDIAGLVKDAHNGAGLGNKFLANIREVDAIIQVVRTFPDSNIVNTLPECNPIEEIQVVQTELILSDLEQAVRAKEKLAGLAHCGNKQAKEKTEFLQKIIQTLNKNTPLYEENFNTEEIREYNLLSMKPVLFLLNISDKTGSSLIKETADYLTGRKNSDYLTVNTQVEFEISQLATVEEQNVFRKEMGITDNQVDSLIKKSYNLLNQITFYTIVGGKELRAWPILKGTAVKPASGKIHSDIEKGFISSEVYSYNDIMKYRSEKELQGKGLIRNEGKDYIVQDGDIIKIKW